MPLGSPCCWARFSRGLPLGAAQYLGFRPVGRCGRLRGSASHCRPCRPQTKLCVSGATVCTGLALPLIRSRVCIFTLRPKKKTPKWKCRRNNSDKLSPPDYRPGDHSYKIAHQVALDAKKLKCDVELVKLQLQQGSCFSPQPR